ncbi:NAD-dependent epimerase/dehydratase family protein [Candidatus Laterigemmans baculatus]|uniref:NAD-dependent epimerase/dehydratase family protein n=1 Tax=Candidatus Laterigemmans baculatus TaxID=2770505 RepID=UPI0013D91B35|nr:NAD(P)-dependent oxidoreductase [Candidatus Laterigemmans baculatus]
MADARPSVIVTGSAGLLGFPVCRELAARGYEVFAFDRVGMPEPPKHLPHVHDVEFEVTDYGTVRGAIDEVRRRNGDHVASVVHLAAFYDFSGEDSPMYEKVTIEGTDRLLNALQAVELEQFLFSSTMLVHAPCEVGEHIREDDPLVAKWPYPASKIKTEQLIRDGHPDVRSVLLRIAGVYNEMGQQPTLVQQIKRIYDRDFQSHFFPGDTSTGQSAVHLDDAVDAIVRTVERRDSIPAGTPILIGEPDPPSYAELQDLIGELIHGREWSTVVVPKALAKVGAAVSDVAAGGDSFIKPFMISMADDHYALDVSRAKEMLGWQPRHRLIDVVPAIVENLKQDPQKWIQENGLQE